MYLVRHDQVDMSGICYGQSDVDSTILYSASADAVRPLLANKVKHVYSSPLKRCFKLANSLFADYEIQTNNALMEVNFGQWEQRAWDDIPRSSLDVWAQSPTNFQFPQGEHLNDFISESPRFGCQYKLIMMIFV